MRSGVVIDSSATIAMLVLIGETTCSWKLHFRVAEHEQAYHLCHPENPVFAAHLQTRRSFDEVQLLHEENRSIRLLALENISRSTNNEVIKST